MTIGLDIGSCSIRSLRRHGRNLVSRSTRNTYAVLPASASQRKLLKQAGIAYAESEQNLVLLGDAAVELSDLFQTPVIAPLRSGHLSEQDPVGRQILACMIDSLLPEPLHGGELCCFSLPGHALERGAVSHEERDFVSSVVRLRGYTPLMLNAGSALILSTMVESGFTGIGIVMGAAASECVLMHQGRELARCAIEQGGNWIDEQFARCSRKVRWDADGDDFLDLDSARKRREGFTGSLMRPHGSEEEAVAELYRALLNELLTKSAQELAAIPQVQRLPEPLDIACVGGLTRVAGFGEMLERAIHAVELPRQTGRVRVVSDSQHTIARGCLIKAELEADSQSNLRAA